MNFQGVYFSYFLTIFSHNVFIAGFIYANQNSLHPIQTNFLRGIATFAINFAIIRYYNLGMQYKIASNHKFLLIRSGAICIHSLTLALCGFYLPQPIIHTINCTGPIFVIIQDYFINNIKINSKQLKGILFTFLGIILTINGQNFANLLTNDAKNYNDNSKFQNYISQQPMIKVLMGILLSSICLIWAYGTIVVKNIVGLNSIHINFHLGIFLTLVTGLLYPIFVTNPSSLIKMIQGLFFCGVPMAIGNILYIHALTINKNTGLVTLCTSSAVFVGYFISIFRYEQSINVICLFGSISIVVGLAIALTAKPKVNQKKSGITEQLVDDIQNEFKKIDLQKQIQLRKISFHLSNPQSKQGIK